MFRIHLFSGGVLLLWTFCCRLTAGIKSFFRRNKASDAEPASPKSPVAPVEFDTKPLKSPNVDVDTKRTMAPIEETKETKGSWVTIAVYIARNCLNGHVRYIQWFSESVSLSFSQSVILLFSQSFYRSFSHSVICSVNQSVSQSVIPPFIQSVSHSVIWSGSQSFFHSVKVI